MDGGAVAAIGSNVMIANETQLTKNTATGAGGAVWAGPGSRVNILDSGFTGNTATGSGGAVYAFGRIDNTITPVAWSPAWVMAACE